MGHNPPDTVRGRLISRNGNRMQRFEQVLDLLPKGHVFDGELVVLNDTGAATAQAAQGGAGTGLAKGRLAPSC